MKQLRLVFLAVLSVFSMASSCSKDDVTPTTNIPAIIVQGNWRVTLYNENGVDKLSQFTGYTFTFASGVVTAVKNGVTVTGTYRTAIDSNKIKFYLDFGTVSQFNELNEDWEILEETSTKIRLTHISGGNGGTDLITFERN